MITQHTPGPWVLVETKYETMISDWKVQIGEDHVSVFPYKRIYSDDRTRSGLVIDRELMTNARLIAAAPDLLEALKAMEARFGCRSSRQEDQPKTYGCHHMAETCTQCDGLVTGWKAVQAARAAIAKATGESS